MTEGNLFTGLGRVSPHDDGRDRNSRGLMDDLSGGDGGRETISSAACLGLLAVHHLVKAGRKWRCRERAPSRSASSVAFRKLRRVPQAPPRSASAVAFRKRRRCMKPAAPPERDG